MKTIRKILKYVCFCCNKSISGKTAKKSSCPACNNTGYFVDDVIYHFYKDKNGKEYCIDGDTGK